MERDTPAKPNAGKALLRRLRLEERFSIAQHSCLLGHIKTTAHDDTRSSVATGASVKKVRKWHGRSKAAAGPSVVFYLLLNAVVTAASFGATFALTYLLSALIRPYRKWLNAWDGAASGTGRAAQTEFGSFSMIPRRRCAASLSQTSAMSSSCFLNRGLVVSAAISRHSAACRSYSKTSCMVAPIARQ